MSFRNPALCVALVALTACGAESPTAATPPASSFNLNGPQLNIEAILRAPSGGGATGSVKFRQPGGGQLIELGTSIRDLAANTDYYLWRATDAQDGSCTGTNWLKLGVGLVPASIPTDANGSGSADLSRDLTGLLPVGTQFDIRFEVRDASGTVVLESGCYQFTSGK